MEKEEARKAVRDQYGDIARSSSGCGCGPSCCDTASISEAIGYTKEDLEGLPEGADLGLGCGNPLAFAELKEGDTFLDLGSGAGIDCFIAAKKVGDAGLSIGVDMTADMIVRARANAEKSGISNVEFRLGEIEHLPVADSTVDLITSNCVINLSPEKKKVFAEAYRVLKPGGKMMISDIVLLEPLPEAVKESAAAYTGCISGAEMKDDYLAIVKNAGFEKISIKKEVAFPVEMVIDSPAGEQVAKTLKVPKEELARMLATVISLQFEAAKPK